MKLQDGTPQAMALLKRFQDSGNLIDVYSGKWKPANPLTLQFTEENFTELDKKFGDEYRNHLLILCLAGMAYSDKQELCAIYPPLTKVFEWNNEPKFLILNLLTQQMLCVGLGRKYRLFMIDAVTEESVGISNVLDADNLSYSDGFLKLDHCNVVRGLLKWLSRLGDAIDENERRSNQRAINSMMGWIKVYFPDCKETSLYPNDPY